MIPTLITERLILRPFSMDDAKRVQLLAGDKDISSTALNIPYPYEDGMAEIWISNHETLFDNNEELIFAIILKSTEELIGAVGIKINSRFRHAELGYWIGKEFWNNGYATEASAKVIHFSFNELALNKIHAHYLARNPSSGKVMEKLGMEQEGYFKQHIYHNGVYEDIIQYSILHENFLKGMKNGKSE